MKLFTHSLVRALLVLLLSGVTYSAKCQLILLDPAGDGGFETGTTFAANNWTTVQPGNPRQWQVGTAAGAQSGTRSAYAGAAANYNGANLSSVQHFYRDITIPAGATNVALSFYFKEPIIDNTYDYFYVFTTTTANTPVSGTVPGTGYTQRFVNTATAYAAFTQIPGIDLTALAGTTVRLVFTLKGDGVTPHSNPAIDNISLTYTAGTACSGTPNAGTATTTSTNICPNTSFTLGLTGSTASSGITYQWQSSPAGQNTFTNLGTAQTSTSYIVTSQAVSTDYQVITTCSNSGLSATSSVVSVSQNSFLTCYCTPGTTSCASSDVITNVTIGTLANTSACGGTNGYNDYTASVAAVSLSQSSTNPISVTVGAGGTEYVSVWIDYDHSGTFDASELTTLGSANGAVITSNIAVPGTALTGNTRMRVRLRYNASITAPCSAYTYGETEDYLVTIAASTPCSGTPPVPMASAPSFACTGQAFMLTAGNLVPVGTTGITYQWESSPAGAGTFTAITGATTVPYNATQTSATDYRLVVTCANGGLTSTSNLVSVGMNSFLSCYCIPPAATYGCNYLSTPYGTINTVTFNTLTHSPGCTGTPYYINVPQATATTVVYPGITYTMSINSGNYDKAGVWIDWNQSGTFDANEYYALGTSNATNFATNKAATITVPAGAITGDTRMRIRTEYYSNTLGSGSACTATSYGETVDYTISVMMATPCSGTPPAASVSASVASTCPAATFTLSASGIPVGISGFTYQWQYRTGTGAFTDLAGATTNPYFNATLQGGTTDYQLVITCSNGAAQTISNNFVTVTQSAFMSCYCTPGSTASTYYINNFTTTGASTTNISNLASGYSTGGYGNFTSQILAVTQGDVISFNTTFGSQGTYDFGGAIFIDYNQNGSFADAGEVVFNTTSYQYTIAGSFTIPLTAMTGTTRMRIVADYLSTNPASEYCATISSGEFEDYTVNITAAPPCVAPTAQATALNLSSTNTTTVSGSFTAASPAASGYIVLQTPGTTTPTATPIDGIVYTPGSILGNATVVAAGTGTTFTNSGLTPGTQYTYTVYAYNNTACTGGPVYYTAAPLSSSVTTAQAATYTGTGAWSNASNWSTGVVPNDCNTFVTIAANSAVTLDGAYQAASVITSVSTSSVDVPAGYSLGVCGNVTNNGIVTVTGGTLTVGTNGKYNNTFSDASGGTLTVSGGTMNVNGNLSVASGAYFTQSSGAIVVDGNAGGVTANSVASGTPIVNFASPNLIFSGGTFTIVDPHPAATLTSVLDYNTTGNVEALAAHTFIFGNGVSTDAGGNVSGARLRLNVTAAGRLNIGSVIANGGAGTNRATFQGAGSAGINGSLTINNAGEYRLNSALYLNGNLTVNAGGILTTQANVMNFSSFTGGVAGNATAAQTVTNNGTIQNAATAATANFAGITVMNTAGVTFNQDASYSGALNFTGVSSTPSVITMANSSKMAQITGSTLGTYGATNGWINGRFQKVAAAGAISHIYPIGDATTYAPVNITGTGASSATAVLTAGNIVASTRPGEHPSINGAKINQDKDVNRYWTIEENSGITFSANSVLVKLNWASTDVDAAATPANFIVGRYLNPAWIYPTVSLPAATSIQALNDQNGSAFTIMGDYITGQEAAKPAITAGLQGAMQTGGTMTNNLQNFNGTMLPGDLLPSTDPYGLGATYTAINNTTGIVGAVTDWVRVDVYDPAAAAPAAPVESRALLLKPNGQIVDTRNLTPAFAVRSGNMRLVVKHRNHLAVMSNNVVMNGVFAYDFTTSLSQASVQAGDPVQMVLVGGKWCLWSGDVISDYFIEGLDFSTVSADNDANLPEGYRASDLNLDGFTDGLDVSVISVNNDFNLYSTLVNY